MKDSKEKAPGFQKYEIDTVLINTSTDKNYPPIVFRIIRMSGRVQGNYVVEVIGEEHEPPIDLDKDFVEDSKYCRIATNADKVLYGKKV